MIFIEDEFKEIEGLTLKLYQKYNNLIKETEAQGIMLNWFRFELGKDIIEIGRDYGNLVIRKTTEKEKECLDRKVK